MVATKGNGTNVRSDMILRQLAKRHASNNPAWFFMTEVKNGPSQIVSSGLLKLDAMAIRKSWVNPCFVGYEVKVSRSDFLRDDKWPGYLSYCHKFYFACPAGLIQPEELQSQVGLIWYNPEKDCITTKRRAVYRPVELDPALLMYVIMNRLDSDRHPFFSSTRQWCEAWVADKLDRHNLAGYVRNKLHAAIQQVMEREVAVAIQEAKIQRCDELEAWRSEILNLLSRHGIYAWAGMGAEILKRLDEALSGRMPPGLIAEMKGLSRSLERTLREAEAGQQ